MRAGLIGFVAGVGLTLLALVGVQRMVLAEVAPDLKYRFDEYVFGESTFPRGDFEEGRLVRWLLFPVKVTTTFFDAGYHVVTQADHPGRYGAVVRANFFGGVEVIREATLYRTPARVFWWESAMPASAQLPAEAGLDAAVLANQAGEIGVAFKNGFVGSLEKSPDFAMLLAGLAETSPGDPPAVWRTDFHARAAVWWDGLAQKFGVAEKYQRLVDLPHDYNADPGKRWPVILFLHGIGERGNDLKLVRHTGLAKVIAEGREIPAIVVSPQCPADESWNPLVLMRLLDEIATEYRVEPSRIYVTGTSSGGDVAWALGMAYPERFAAIVPICGEGDFADAARLVHVPIWAFHGMKDPTVPVSETIGMVEAVRKAGGTAHLTLFPDDGHDSWDDAYATKALMPWLLAQRQGQPEVITPDVPIP